MTSLNPVITVGHQIVESLRVHLGMSRGAARREALDLLASVGIPDAGAGWANIRTRCRAECASGWQSRWRSPADRCW